MLTLRNPMLSDVLAGGLILKVDVPLSYYYLGRTGSGRDVDRKARMGLWPGGGGGWSLWLHALVAN